MQTSVHKAREAEVIPVVTLGDDHRLAGEAVVKLLLGVFG
jgi:hypothetical protein